MQEAVMCMVATPKSHPFEERRIKVGPESDPVKIGRAVARTQPTDENGVFDCKVLSRNHAIVWYNKGVFWIRDTKSSNGTFVNNEKLLAQGKDSDARKIFSGDIIQLGVEIVENTNKVAYGCIYAVIQCYNEEGKLVSGGNLEEIGGFKNGGTLLSDRKLFQMQQYLSEAIYREKLREDKITELMSIIEANEQAAETAWKSLVNEDRLLAKIEALEAQLTVSTNNNEVDKLKEDTLTMIDEKTKFEAMTKDTIRRLQEENGEMISRLKDLERSLDNTETTCNQLRSTTADLENMLAETTEMNKEQQYELMNEETYRIQIEDELANTKKKLQDIQQKFLALSKTSVENETATSLSRLLANALNGGSIIAQQELTLLIDSLSNANYLPTPIDALKLAENQHLELYSAENNEAPENMKKKEDYLKEILELQAKNRKLENDLSRISQLNTILQIQIAEENAENCHVAAAQNLSENHSTEKRVLLDITTEVDMEIEGEEESSDNSGNSILEFGKSGKNSMKINDGLAQFSLLFSIAPIIAIFLSIFVPINNRFFGKVPKSLENDKKEDEKSK
ncbi:unnamed protein product [Caenorhabditis angaria]|uniref:FHA domain-containing protein n=1 Tax=Caenorhabditis angaria TaxID=860376 RepID=A0A9P1IPC5_9PELO|nr:unnamed protein product [Caenorhabditis angaria]